VAVFAPDLFSLPSPGWVPVSEAVAEMVSSVLASVGDVALVPTGPAEQADGLELNSSNLRISTRAGRFVLKRWSSEADPRDTLRTVLLMDWLHRQGLAVPQPVRLGDAWVYEHEGRRWSLFSFIEGSCFIGHDGEAESAAISSGRLARVLASVPAELAPGLGPSHLSDADDALFARMNQERGQWNEYLGSTMASQLKSAWDRILRRWVQLRESPPEAGVQRASHFDLHPRNLLMRGQKVVAILDFESCRSLPIGYAMAFAGLKQGRQAVVAGGNALDAPRVGRLFVERYRTAFPATQKLDRVADLAAVEVLRRIAVILRLNVEQRIANWNGVLPVQIAHLEEANALFPR
jgi:Ser/Thr protein kinase RdoA (MazF antagonist)